MARNATAPALDAPALDAPALDAPALADAEVPTDASNAPDVLADFKVAPARKRIYTANPDAVRADVLALAADGAPAPVITRGKHDRTGAPVLMLVNGDNVQALPLNAIGAAIAHGVITREEITALLGD